MPKPTLSEIYALPEPLHNDNFDLAHIYAGENNPSFSSALADSFRILHNTCQRVHWKEGDKREDNRLTLWFADILGDQNYLDAHKDFKRDFQQLDLHVYDKAGQGVRAIVFEGLEFEQAQAALDAADGKHVERVLIFRFENMQEIALPA